MEENNKNKGIFFGIIAIATLIVAIIGATFAYFSSSVTTANDAVNFTAYDFSATLDVEKISPSGDINNLIPVLMEKEENSQMVPTGYLEALLENDCIDDNGYAACALYHITVNNYGNSEITLTGKLVTENGGNFENLQAHFVTITEGQGGEPDTYTLVGNPIDINEGSNETTTLTNPTSGSNGNFTVSAVTPAVGGGDPTPGTASFDLVIYLNDNGFEQTAEMGQTYVGELKFESTTGSDGKLTAQINV